MKVARIASVIAIVIAMPSAFAAGMGDITEKDQASVASSARQWYQTGDFERQSAYGRAELDRQGFPQYGQ